MWSHNNFLDKSDPQFYKRSRAAYVGCQQGLLTGSVEGGLCWARLGSEPVSPFLIY